MRRSTEDSSNTRRNPSLQYSPFSCTTGATPSANCSLASADPFGVGNQNLRLLLMVDSRAISSNNMKAGMPPRKEITPDHKDKVAAKDMSKDSTVEEAVGKFTLDPINDQLAKTVFEHIVMQQVEYGNITHDEIADRTFLDKIRQILSDEIEIILILNHTQAILKKARKERLRLPEEAILHYALYIQHKINILIQIISERNAVDHSATLGLMRELKLPLRLLGHYNCWVGKLLTRM